MVAKKEGKSLIARMQVLPLCNKLANPPFNNTAPSSSFTPAPMFGLWLDASFTYRTAKQQKYL